MKHGRLTAAERAALSASTSAWHAKLHALTGEQTKVEKLALQRATRAGLGDEVAGQQILDASAEQEAMLAAAAAPGLAARQVENSRLMVAGKKAAAVQRAATVPRRSSRDLKGAWEVVGEAALT